MALRIEDLSGPRNITALQSLNRLNWKDFNNLPDLNNRLTIEEATILKEQRGETYNGPYMPQEEYLPNPVAHKLRGLKVIEGGNKPSETLIYTPRLHQQSQEVLFEKFSEPLDEGKYDSSGNRL